MNSDEFVIRLSECNRCGCRSYEKLAHHGYCVNCNYSPYGDDGDWEDFAEIPRWALEAIGEKFPTRNENTKNQVSRQRLSAGPELISA